MAAGKGWAARSATWLTPEGANAPTPSRLLAHREAREEAIGKDETDKKIALCIKDKIGAWYAPLVWLAVQVAIFAYLFESLSPPLLTTDFVVFLPAAIGLAFAPLLSSLRRERWVRQPGVEDGDGALERLLVDAALDSYALPAPFEFNLSDPQVRASRAVALFRMHTGTSSNEEARALTDGLAAGQGAHLAYLDVYRATAMRPAAACWRLQSSSSLRARVDRCRPRRRAPRDSAATDPRVKTGNAWRRREP